MKLVEVAEANAAKKAMVDLLTVINDELGEDIVGKATSGGLYRCTCNIPDDKPVDLVIYACPSKFMELYYGNELLQRTRDPQKFVEHLKSVLESMKCP